MQRTSMNGISKIALSAAIGGTAEALGGGKFANGAVTGAYVMMLNHLASQVQKPDWERLSKRMLFFDDVNDAYKYMDVLNSMMQKDIYKKEISAYVIDIGGGNEGAIVLPFYANDDHNSFYEEFLPIDWTGSVTFEGSGRSYTVITTLHTHLYHDPKIGGIGFSGSIRMGDANNVHTIGGPIRIIYENAVYSASSPTDHNLLKRLK